MITGLTILSLIRVIIAKEDRAFIPGRVLLALALTHSVSLHESGRIRYTEAVDTETHICIWIVAGFDTLVDDLKLPEEVVSAYVFVLPMLVSGEEGAKVIG